MEGSVTARQLDLTPPTAWYGDQPDKVLYPSATGWWPPRTPTARVSRRSDMTPELGLTLPEFGAYVPPASKVAAR